MRTYLGISTKLIFMSTVSVFIAIAAVTYVATDLFRQESVTRVQEMNKDLAESLANQTFKVVEKSVDQTKVIFQTLVPNGKPSKTQEGINLAQNILRQNDEMIGVGIYKVENDWSYSEVAFLAKDEVVAEFDTNLNDFKQKPFNKIYDAVRRDKWSDFFVVNTSSFFKKPMLSFIIMIADSPATKFHWLLRCDIRQESLLKLFSKKLPTTSYWADADGNILVHSDPSLVLKNYNFGAYSIFLDAHTSKIDNGQTEFTDDQGTQFLGAFRKLKFNNSVIISQLESSYALAAINQVEYRSALVAFIALGLAFVFNFIFSKSLTSPIETLYLATEKIAQGQFDFKLIPQSGDEIGVLTTSFMKMMTGLQERDKLKSTFNKFHSKEIAQKILTGEVRLGGEKKVATVFFSDIRGFTSMAEDMSPDEVVNMLNEYMTEMVKIVQKHKGVVDKYIGDAIMALWGVPEATPQDAVHCMKAALEMREALIHLNKKRVLKGKPEMKIGMGIHTGEVLAGNIGSEERLEYTVIGDTVNQACRLESANKDTGTDILISDTTYAIIKNSGFAFGPSISIKVKGKSEKIVAHGVVGTLDSNGKTKTWLNDAEKDLVLNPRIHEAAPAPVPPDTGPHSVAYPHNPPTMVAPGFAPSTAPPLFESPAPPPVEIPWFLVRDMINQIVEGPFSVAQLRVVAGQPGFPVTQAHVYKEGDQEMIPLVELPGFSRRAPRPRPAPVGVAMPSPAIINQSAPSDWFVYGSDTNTYGPYSLQQLEQALYAGSITRTTYVWKQGMQSWMYLHQIPGFNRRDGQNDVA